MTCTFDAKPVALPELPRGYVLGEYAPGTEQRWCELLNASGLGSWTPEMLHREMLSGLVPGGAAFIAFEGQLVACAAACRRAETAPNAVLMYVGVLPDHRRKGLGTVVTLAAREASRRAGYPGMTLLTDDYRPAAIKTYLNLGFVPDKTTDSTAAARWDKALASLENDATQGPRA